MAIQFTKAVKYEAKGRVAIIGPAGSGKSYTSLKLARQLAGPDGKIAALDTEHGSLSKYADLTDFDVFELDSYSPNNFLEALSVAQKNNYQVLLTDSLSHFWMGKDGALEYVDNAKRRSSSRDEMSGWKDFSPVERSMVDAMISATCHVIVTMRTKTDYVEQIDERTGKKKRVKIGLAPVQRQGLEYEFDLIGYMDEDNTFVVDKSRCPALNGKALARPSDRDFHPFVEWLKGATPIERQPVAPAPITATVSKPWSSESKQAASAVAERKIAELNAKQIEAPVIVEDVSPEPPPIVEAGDSIADPPKAGKPKSQYTAMMESIQLLKAEFIQLDREEQYYLTLEGFGFKKSNEIKTVDKGREVYKSLLSALKRIREATPIPGQDTALPISQDLGVSQGDIAS